MKLNMDETSLVCNAPVWQQLLPSSTAVSAAPVSTERAVRIEIPSDSSTSVSPTETGTPRHKRSSTTSWLNFATSWNSSGNNNTSRATAGQQSQPVDGVFRQAINSTDSTAEEVLLHPSASGVEEKSQPSSPLMK